MDRERTDAQPLTDEEIDAEAAAELPDREAMSVIARPPYEPPLLTEPPIAAPIEQV